MVGGPGSPEEQARRLVADQDDDMTEHVAQSAELMYLETLLQRLRDSGRAMNRSLLLLTLFALLLLTSDAGALSIGSYVTVAGLRIEFDPRLFLGGVSTLVAALWMYVFALTHHMAVLRRQIFVSCDDLGWKSVRWRDSGLELVAYPDFFSVTFSGSRYFHTLVSKITQVCMTAVFVPFVLLFPLLTLVLSARTLWKSGAGSWPWLVWMVFVLVVSIGYVITMQGQLTREHRRMRDGQRTGL